jgi:CMP-N-acetylneuraminic acid synthetase
VYKSSCLTKKKFEYSGFVIPRYKGIDIDTADDWALAEKIFKNNMKKN